MSAKKVRLDDQVMCDICQSSLSVRNWNRHRHKQHGETDASVRRRQRRKDCGLLCSSSSSSQTGLCEVPHRGVTTEGLVTNSDDTCNTQVLMEAAQQLLQEHHRFTPVELMDYVKSSYRQIPLEW